MTSTIKDFVKEIVKYSPFYLQSIIMKGFMIECETKLFDPDYLCELEAHVNELASDEPNKFLHFLLEIGVYLNNGAKEKILEYVIMKYRGDLHFYEVDIYHMIRNMKSSHDDKMRWIEIFSDEEYKYLHYHIHREIGTKEWYDRYIKNYRSLTEIKKENEYLKKQIEILQTQIDFMPEGKGYHEAKKNFDSMLNKI